MKTPYLGTFFLHTNIITLFFFIFCQFCLAVWNLFMLFKECKPNFPTTIVGLELELEYTLLIPEGKFRRDK